MAKSKKSGKKPKTAKPSVKEEKLPKETEKVEKKDEKEVKAEKVEKTEKVVKTEKSEKPAQIPAQSAKKNTFCGKFWAKKYEENESILTIFKDHKIYGNILGEVFGTMFIALIIFTLGLSQPLYMFFILLGVVIAVYKLSGAQLNPINTVGMMVTRRMSAIRGVLYLLAQVVGAWLGYVIVKAFISTSAGVTGTESEFPSMAVIQEGYYWVVAFLEFLGAAIVGFFYARAQQYKKSVVAFATVVAGGMTIAVVVVYLLSYAYFGLSGNFMLNPAISLMYGIMPSAADGVMELLGGIAQALFCYVLFPVIGGVIGFWLSDTSNILAEEK
ncbi:aquaporin [Candidatus Saccharibacteria bacterium]|nr:aquaporin [Candidatus Saccharibacteria bacterium]